MAVVQHYINCVPYCTIDKFIQDDLFFFCLNLVKRMKQLRLRVGFWVWAKSYSSRMMTVQNNLFIRAHAITSIYVKSTGSSSSSGKFSPLMQKWLLQGWFFFLSQLFLCTWIFEKREQKTASIQPTKIIRLTTGNSVPHNVQIHKRYFFFRRPT